MTKDEQIKGMANPNRGYGGVQEARPAPVQKATIPDGSQDWAGMSGITAWHLIDRWANNWADIGKMMGEWLAANTPPAAQHQCKWPTCQSEEYQQALAEQINQELVTGAAQQAPMTEFEDAVAACDNTLHYAIDHWQDRALKAEALLAQPEQEPVAWMFQHGETGRMSFVSNDGMNNPELFLAMNPRYALVCALVTPPAAQPAQERNFCPRCGKRTADLTTIHTCTPPQEKNT
jgi:hypothetical protein